MKCFGSSMFFSDAIGSPHYRMAPSGDDEGGGSRPQPGAGPLPLPLCSFSSLPGYCPRGGLSRHVGDTEEEIWRGWLGADAQSFTQASVFLGVNFLYFPHHHQDKTSKAEITEGLHRQ